MEAYITNFKVQPKKFNSKGEITKPKRALVMLEIPLDTDDQTEDALGLTDIMSTTQTVDVQVSEKQLNLPLGEQEIDESATAD